jgi:predicted RNA-binding protein YlxR (DUF448 family)
MCLGCREMKEKRNLVRMVKAPDCAIHIDDVKGKSPGRGAYICLNSTCIDKVIKTKAFERAFGQKIESDVYDLLRTELLNRKISIQQKEIKGEIDG